MTQIEKIKAEIERRKNQFVSQAEAFHKIGKEDKESYYAALASNMNSLSCFIDSLEVKDVNLEREIDDTFLKNKCNITDNVSLVEFVRIAKHFFELGLKAQKGE